MTTSSYYKINAGHFGLEIAICFSDESYQQVVKDSGITGRHHALETGMAESHYIAQEGSLNALMCIVFNYEEMRKLDDLERLGVIYHEVSHTTTHVFQYIGEDETKIGDESRSYLGEHLFKQVVAVYLKEEENRKNARKRNRELSNKKSQAIVGALLQMVGHDNGGTGQNCNTEPKSDVCGAEDTKGSAVSPPKIDFLGVGQPRISSNNYPQQV